MSFPTAPMRSLLDDAHKATLPEGKSEVLALNLDQIESHSGKVLSKLMLDRTEVGSSTYVFNKGTVLYCKLRPYLNKVVVAENDGVATTELVPLRCDESKILPNYLAHFLRSPTFLAFATNVVAGAKMPRMVMSEFWSYPVPLPPLSDQRRIAAILDQAEALRTQRHTALALLDSLTQSLFLDMFGDPVTNPKRWDISTIGELAEVQGGLQVTRTRTALPLEVPYLRVANVYRGVLDLSEIKTIRATPAELRRTILVKDDLLVVEGHGNPNEIGRAALWSGEIEQCVHQNHLIRARFNRDKVDPVFASEYVNSPGGRLHLLRAGKSTSGLNTISVSNVRDTPVALPPLALQNAFAARIQSIAALKAVHRKALAALDALFTSLQHRAFRGELASTTTDKNAAAPRSPAQDLEGLLRLEASIGQEALIYIAKRMPKGDQYNTLKAIYFADKHHLEHYGHQIYGETYCALPHGPVPQAAYDATRVLIGERMFSDFDDGALRAALRLHGHTLTALRDADFSKLSPAMVESLDWAVRYCRDMKFGQTKAASHDSAYERTPKNETVPLRYIVDTLSPEARQRHWNL
ncbi:restriction endonuclease subunit S [Acidovorax sp.]|uniref:restriction endonuclease subunit S n=1 Tax=Acidovorax sp. TaxID=1872122 RepID=UPI002ACD6615|nr:restriction endonuclease subunit S [Acidovorax sp.]MDZ7865020.1 restriction endonuclease subunit S [Acidovorax sp.]